MEILESFSCLRNSLVWQRQEWYKKRDEVLTGRPRQMF